MDGGVAQIAPAARADTRLIAAEDAAVALQGLAQAAGPGLHVAGPLAGTLAAQPLADIGQAALPPSEVVAGAIDVDDTVTGPEVTLEQRDGTDEAADVV